MYVMTFYNLITLKKSCVSGKLTNNYLRIMTLDETDECPNETNGNQTYFYKLNRNFFLFGIPELELQKAGLETARVKRHE